MARFTLPRDLYHGKGALEALKTFKGKKAMICVGGGSMKRFGFLARAEQYLKEAGIDVYKRQVTYRLAIPQVTPVSRYQRIKESCSTKYSHR